jgi:hypothetical protein
MKTSMYIFGVLSLLLAGAACNELDNQEQLWDGTGIRPVAVSNEIAAFLDENVEGMGRSIFYKYYDRESDPLGWTWERISNHLSLKGYVDSCVMIGSVDEYRRLTDDGYPEEVPPELPAINFNTHTLVIVQWINCDHEGHHYVASHGLVVEQNIATMNLVIGVNDPPVGYAITAYEHPTPAHFWILYPKINAETIRMVVRRD